MISGGLGLSTPIGHLRSKDPLDAAIARLATRQHGNVTFAQLIAIGLTKKAIDHRVRTGRLFRVYRGVFSVGRPPMTPLERASAAVLACGPGAALSHASAMTHWGFWRRWDTPFEVTVTRDRRPAGITVHLSTTLHRRDITTRLGIRTTTPARTIFDMAARLTDRQRKRAIKEALVTNLTTEHHLAELLHRHPHHPATRLLTPFVAGPVHRTRSDLEDLYPTFCKRYDVPIPLTDVKIGRYHADFYYPQQKLIVEIDSHEYHDNPVSFETDRDRDADTLELGIATVRLTEERILKTPRKEAERLNAILAARTP